MAAALNTVLSDLSLDGILQLFARFKFNYVAGLDFNRLTGLGISSFSGLTTGLLESSKTHQGYFAIFFLQRLGF